MIKLWTGALAASLFSLAALAEGDGGLLLEDAWVRAMPPTSSNTAAYLKVTNTADAAVAITGASAEAAGRVEIHTSREVDGYVRMEQLQGLALAAGESVLLEPGGIHLMLLELAYVPQVGDELRLCLQTATGDQSCTVAATRRGGDHQQHQHH